MSKETQDIMNRRKAISIEINSNKIVLDRTYMIKTPEEKEELKMAKKHYKKSLK